MEVVVGASIAPRPTTTLGVVPQGRLKERVARFGAGEFVPVLEMSLECSAQGNAARSRRRRRTTDDLQSRAGRALGLTQMEKLSHARRALEEEAVALGSEKTWKALTDNAKRPRISREGVDQDLLDMNPAVPVDLDVDLLLKNFEDCTSACSSRSIRNDDRASEDSLGQVVIVPRCLARWPPCLLEDKSHQRFWQASDWGE